MEYVDRLTQKQRITRTISLRMNICEMIRPSSDDHVALVGPDRRTYRELHAEVGLIRANLLSEVSPGASVVVVGATSIAFVEAVLGALSAGCAIVPVHARQPVAELEHAIGVTRPAMIIAADPAGLELPQGCNVPVRSVSELLAPAATVPALVQREASDTAVLLMTSGTSGRPKIAMLSHANIQASIAQTLAGAEQLRAPGHIVLGVVPLTHVLGLVSVLMVSLHTGATVVLDEDLSAESVAAALLEHRPTLLVAPPVFWYRLSQSELTASALSSVRLAVSGAAPLPGVVARSVADRFGIQVRQAYGLTEASPALASAIGTEAPASSVGRPLPGVEMRLIDDFGHDALVGDVGEILARGANIFTGYLDDDAATAEVLDADGWLHTGDLAVVDESGHLFIVGRAKDLIIVSGFNVHPGDVEQTIQSHPRVREAAVVGEADLEFGERVVAYVVASDVTLPPEEADLDRHCRASLAGYKCPSRFEMVEELPRGATGKLKRRALR